MDTKSLGPNAASYAVIAAAMKVHSVLGAGMLESTICACLIYEFNLAGLHVQHQVRLPVVYGEITLPGAYRVDFIIEECLMVEIKCVEKLLPVHHAQLMTYLRVSHFKPGLLINLNVPHLRDGIRRIINGREDELEDPLCPSCPLW